VKETKSPDLENKTAVRKESTAGDPQVTYRATTKEASTRKAELAAGGVSQQAGLWETMKKAGRAAVNAPAEASAAVSTESAIRQQQVEKLAVRQYPQDMVPGGYFEVESIMPSTTNTTKNIERVEDLSVGDRASRKYHSEQHRDATPAALESRLKELNKGGELTPFEKQLVADWDPRRNRLGPNGEDPLHSLSPIYDLDSTGTKGSKEVQAYKVVRGGSGHRQTTYYDRDGNQLTGTSNRGGDAIPTIGPYEILSAARLGAKVAINTGRKIGEKITARGAGEATKNEARMGANTADKKPPNPPHQDINVANKTQTPPQNQNASWREGSGTSIHTKPKGPASPAPKSKASEFTAAEENEIKKYIDKHGLSRKEAEDLIKYGRPHQGTVQVSQPNGPNDGGTTRVPEWQKKGPGKHKP
jgi:hypothetical protein